MSFLNPRDRVICVLNLEEPDVIPVHDSPWPETINRWMREGYPTSGVEPKNYFGYSFAFITSDISQGTNPSSSKRMRGHVSQLTVEERLTGTGKTGMARPYSSAQPSAA